MELKNAILVFILSVTVAVVHCAYRDRNNQRYKVVCYWGAWSFYRHGIGTFRPEDANPNLCTHMIYGFTKLNADNTIGIFDPDLDVGDTDYNSGLQWGQGCYRRFNELRNYNKHLTTLIAIGGWNEGSDKYSTMVQSATARKTFVDSVVKFLQTHDFDGLDVDWEYPSMTAPIGDHDRLPGNDTDKQNYVELLKELHVALQPGGYLLTAAVSAGRTTMDRAYDIPQVNRYLDFINVMSYDFHGGWENKTGHNAPLYPKSTDTELNQELTVEFAIDYWLKHGAEPKKVIMGMPLYGRTFTLNNANANGYYADVQGKGREGRYTQLMGTIAYYEICQQLQEGGWQITRDNTYKVPYAVKDRQWVGYDDVESIKEKVRFLKNKNLGGGMVWSIDTDDFRGLCHGVKYPLLKAISGDLNGIVGPDLVIPETHVTAGTANPTFATQSQTSGPTTTTTSTTTSSTQTSTRTSSVAPTASSGFRCTSTGWFADPDPRVYHECATDGRGGYIDYVSYCGEGTHYDPEYKVCRLV